MVGEQSNGLRNQSIIQSECKGSGDQSTSHRESEGTRTIIIRVVESDGFLREEALGFVEFVFLVPSTDRTGKFKFLELCNEIVDGFLTSSLSLGQFASSLSSGHLKTSEVHFFVHFVS